MVTGTFLLNNHYVSVLFDTGVSKSFVSIAFRPLITLAGDIQPLDRSWKNDWRPVVDQTDHRFSEVVTGS